MLVYRIKSFRVLFKLFTQSFKSQVNIMRIAQPTILRPLGLILWPMKKKIGPSFLFAEDIPVLDKADLLFQNGDIEECMRLLEESDHQEKDEEIQWRKCRVLYNMAKDQRNLRESNDLIIEAFTIIAVQLLNHPDNYAVQKWYAVLLDARSALRGRSARIKQLENVKRHLEIAVKLNPTDATSLHMLGEWCFQLADMPWHQRKIAEFIFESPPYSSYEEALDFFLRAEVANPRFYSLNLLRIGTCYFQLRKAGLAKYYLSLAASYPAKTVEDRMVNKEAKVRLKLFKCPMN